MSSTARMSPPASGAPGWASSPQEAMSELAAGRFVVVVGARGREDQGDLTLAAEFVTPHAINFMVSKARGLTCLALTPERCEKLELTEAGHPNPSPTERGFLVSIEARTGVTTGISAADRAHTIAVAVDPRSTARDLIRPGHVIPIRARPGGVVERPGRGEAGVDLARLAGLMPAAVLCEVLNDDGEPARVRELIGYCREHGLRIVRVADIVAYRRARENVVDRVGALDLPTAAGTCRAVAFRERLTGQQHIALVHGDILASGPVPVRINVECLAGQVLGSRECGCAERLARDLRCTMTGDRGVMLYLGTSDRGLTGLVAPEPEQPAREADPDASATAVQPTHQQGWNARIVAEVLARIGIREPQIMEER